MDEHVDEQSVERRLTTILAADVVGYSRLMSIDEAGTLTHLDRLAEARAAVKTAPEFKPGLSLSLLKDMLPSKQLGGLEPWLDGLRKAGRCLRPSPAMSVPATTRA